MVYIIRLIVLPVKTFLEFFLLMREILICRVAYLPRDVNIIRDVKDSRNTACGHNDFCSVRLNGPIW